MNKWFELLLGLILVIVPIVLAFYPGLWTGWGAAALTVLKGGIFWGVVGLGSLLILLGISDLKN